MRKALEDVVETLTALGTGLSDSNELFELAASDDDDATLESIELDANGFQEAGSAGIPPHVLEPGRPAELLPGHPGRRRRHGAQDWASMLLRQYLKYAERKGFKAEVLEESEGEVAGLKSATIKIEGEYAWLPAHRDRRAPPGAQEPVRLVGRPPHVVRQRVRLPEVDDSFEVEVNPADLRVDTYRASGAGGQHINKTDSAVRLTHMPTGIVVQCQNDRSQHRNRAEAMQMLKSKLYELEMRNRMAEQQKLEDSRPTWAGATRSVPMCWTRAASGPAHQRGNLQHRRCWTATWTRSSRPA